jgi:hypothetical protein
MIGQVMIGQVLIGQVLIGQVMPAIERRPADIGR